MKQRKRRTKERNRKQFPCKTIVLKHRALIMVVGNRKRGNHCYSSSSFYLHFLFFIFYYFYSSLFYLFSYSPVSISPPLTPYNRKYNVLSASLNKTLPPPSIRQCPSSSPPPPHTHTPIPKSRSRTECSSVVRLFANGAMGPRIDPS